MTRDRGLVSKRGQDPSLHRLRFGHQIDGRKSVVEVLQWCEDNNLDPHEVTISGGHLMFTRLETEAERDKRVAWSMAADDRHRAWVRDRFRAMFGDGDADLCGLVHDGFPCNLPHRHDGECAPAPRLGGEREGEGRADG